MHAQDIRRPLGLSTAPDTDAVTEVARFYAQRDFTVPSRTTIDGLRLDATDSSFTTASGPLVRGSTLALTMAMAGRSVYHTGLSGPGVATLGARGR